MPPREKFNQISPSEFFYRNRDLAGFSNPTRSLYTAVREFVENGLDACDQSGTPPDIRLSIRAADRDRPDPRPYVLTVADNGPGVESSQIPLAFGTVLYGSKFGLKQARGMFGLGATMAILYGQITTNRPVVVKSSTDGKWRDEYELLLDIQKNKPVVLKHRRVEAAKRGLSVSISLEGDYSKAGSRIRDYVYQTSLITPYASVTFDDPKGERFQYKRIVASMPEPPTVIRPHPYGVDVETIRRMTVENAREMPRADEALAKKVNKELGIGGKKGGSLGDALAGAKKKWTKLTGQARLMAALMALLGRDMAGLSRVRVDDIDAANRTITYWDYDASESRTVGMGPDADHYKALAEIAAGDTLTAFLTKRFQRVGKSTAEKFAKFAGFRPEHRLGTMTNQELVKLSEALQKFTDFFPPDPSCLAPLGAEPLEKGIRKFFEPDFSSVVQRSASAYSGFPFVVEMGVAYGGGIQTRGAKVYRFANRIPLLYDEGSDVVLKVSNDIDWKRYSVGPDPPLVIVSHICSTRIPYKTVGKENVADRQEIEKEIRLALQYLLRKLASYMKRKGRAEAAKKRANLYSKYVPLIAQFCTELAGKKSEPDYGAMLAAEREAEAATGGAAAAAAKPGGAAAAAAKPGGAAAAAAKPGGAAAAAAKPGGAAAAAAKPGGAAAAAAKPGGAAAAAAKPGGAAAAAAKPGGAAAAAKPGGAAAAAKPAARGGR